MQKRIDEMSVPELQALVQQLGQTLHQRGEPQALAVLDTFERWCAMAENPGDPNYMAARSLIQRHVRLQERMRAITTGIHVVGN